MTQAMLSANNLAEAKAIIYPQLKPKTRKNGDVIYWLKDGGLVEDTAKGVFEQEATEAAILLALALAQERFPNQLLIIIAGNAEFKSSIAQMTVTKGMNLCFDAPELEQDKQNQVEVQKARADEHTQEPNLKASARTGQRQYISYTIGNIERVPTHGYLISPLLHAP